MASVGKGIALTWTLLKFYLFIFILAALGLCCYTLIFSSCSEWGLLSSYGAMALWLMGFSRCGTQAWLPHGMWILGPGVEPVSPCIDRGILNHWKTEKSTRTLIYCSRSHILLQFWRWILAIYDKIKEEYILQCSDSMSSFGPWEIPARCPRKPI